MTIGLKIVNQGSRVSKMTIVGQITYRRCDTWTFIMDVTEPNAEN